MMPTLDRYPSALNRNPPWHFLIAFTTHLVILDIHVKDRACLDTKPGVIRLLNANSMAEASV